MSDEFYTRALLVKERVDRLYDEAKRTTDESRLDAITAEMDQLLENLRDIREEQLIAQLPKPSKPPWWRRLFGSNQEG